MLRVLAIFIFMFSSAQASFEEYEEPKATASLISPSNITSDEIVFLTSLVNAAYRKGEEGILRSDSPRTSVDEVKQLINQGQLIGLRIDEKWQGCIRVNISPYDKTAKSGMFGMLAVADDVQYRGKGYGTLLVDAAEKWAKDNGYEHMMLELLQPVDWVQPHKKMLEDWYIRIGYKHTATGEFPHIEALVPQKYIFKIFKKDLKS